MSAPDGPTQQVELGQRMRGWRERSRLSRESVVELTRHDSRPVKLRTLQTWEDGCAAVPAWAIVTLSQLYGCTSDELLGIGPPVRVLVDRPVAEMLLETTKENADEAIRDLIRTRTGQEPFSWMMTVRDGHEWCTEADAQELRRRLRDHLEKVAKSRLKRWHDYIFAEGK